ncbi:MAG TPA: prepilin-type N-terminal cleavage/methylation domain-containing protein, partial [Candidatus Angelobacter sp.]|nr:prepilin-type N-terminal cleavage/methylation domain-containing protein [Candidatus Angelobacter sp.]
MNKKTSAFTIVELPTSPRLRLVKSGRQTLSLSKGFTIVELLVAIVIIGILATLTIISYIGIQQKAIVASINSDLV